jgi:ribose 5-phosphate isomerase RpiB
MASFRLKIKFENSSLPTHGEFSIKNQIWKLVTTHSRRVFDSKSNSKTRHYPHLASLRFKIIFENLPLPTHGEFSIINQIQKLVTTRLKLIIDDSPLPTHGEFLIKNQIRKLVTTHTWRVFDSKSNSKTRHYPYTASFWFKIIFENSPLPTHGEFLIKNQIRKLVTTHTRRVFDSKSYSKTRHYSHMASFWIKIKFENSSLPTHGKFSIQNHFRKLVTTHTWRVFD